MIIWTALACAPAPEPFDPGLSVEAVTKYVRNDVKSPREWAEDVRASLHAANRTASEANVCMVLSIIEQESGYQPDPAVPGLAGIARKEIEAKVSMLGPFSDLGVDWLLSVAPEGVDETFGDRLAKVRTERDLDLLFRDILNHHEQAVPGLQAAGASLFSRRLELLNPVQTAGSMQVSVLWAQDRGRAERIPSQTVRDLLYTRKGGVHYGTARLFAHDAPYDKPIYRFADYNAGLYASRNAAFQEQLSKIMNLELAPDGDLMSWTDTGKPKNADGETLGALLAWRALYAPELPESRLRRDVKREKDASFEETATFALVRSTYKAKTGKEPAFARMPDVALNSPKMSKQKTTSWFATNVEKRYDSCRGRN